MTPGTALRLENVFKEYPGPEPVRVLHGVSLTLRPGRFCLLEGPSGSGKTTLLSIAAGLEPPSRGRVLVREQDLRGFANGRLEAFRRDHVGFVFQDFKLIDVLTAEENAALPLELRGMRPREARAAARKALARIGLSGRLGARPATLSGGEKQRVAIVRALIAGPSLLLADEPTANLDGATGHEVAALLRRAARERGAAVLVASHDPRLAALADETVRLLDGALEEPTGNGSSGAPAAWRTP
jgi:putative ABC transport system ATP-binding protein